VSQEHWIGDNSPKSCWEDLNEGAGAMPWDERETGAEAPSPPAALAQQITECFKA